MVETHADLTLRSLYWEDLPAEPHREVRFAFVPDRLGVRVDETVALEDDHAHVWPGLTLPGGDPCFPHTAHA